MIATLQLSAQSYNYSYTDPCTGQLKSLSVPINGSVAISYYGQIQNFSAAELQNGTFANWTTFNTYTTLTTFTTFRTLRTFRTV